MYKVITQKAHLNCSTVWLFTQNQRLRKLDWQKERKKNQQHHYCLNHWLKAGSNTNYNKVSFRIKALIRLFWRLCVHGALICLTNVPPSDQFALDSEADYGADLQYAAMIWFQSLLTLRHSVLVCTCLLCVSVRACLLSDHGDRLKSLFKDQRQNQNQGGRF